MAAYLSLSLENRTAAVSLLNEIEKSYGEIRRMPIMYEACHTPRLKELGDRKAVIHNYILICRVDSKAETVYMVRLFHGRQDRLFHGRQDYEKQLSLYTAKKQSVRAVFLFMAWGTVSGLFRGPSHAVKA